MCLNKEPVHMFHVAPAVLLSLDVRDSEAPLVCRMVPIFVFDDVRIEATSILDLAKHDVVHSNLLWELHGLEVRHVVVHHPRME